MRNNKLIAAGAISMSAMLVAGCSSGGGGGATDDNKGGGDGTITMGFAQVGAESGWRTANTKSIQETAEAEGIDLKFSDAQGKQENQIKAIRSYIQQKVDVIAFSPVVETGWDAVLQEAKRAKIPVILTDRAVDTEDSSLYETFLGSDFVIEGEKAGQWLVDNAADADGRQRRRHQRGRAAGHHRCRSGDRPRGGLGRRSSATTRHLDRRLADR